MSDYAPQTMRNAFIRISSQNNTENGLKVYTFEDIKNMCKEMCDRYPKTTYALISHDKDKNADGPAMLHFHVCLFFNTVVKFKYVKEVFPYGNIQPMKNSHASIQYLIHKNNPEKTQYSKSDIFTNMKQEDLDTYFINTEKVKKIRQQDEASQLYGLIASGEVREFELLNYVSLDTFVNYKNKIKNAFDAFAFNWELKQCKNNIEVWFFTGGSGNGKTTIAKAIAESIIQQGKYKGICISSSSNDPLQDYKGQDFLILDDLRDNAFTYTDLVKLLDNNTRSSIKSRYNNKTFYGKYIFITSYLPLEDWYKNRKNKNDAVNEDKKQLYRRITKYFNILSDKVEEYNILDGDLNNKDFIRSYNNLIPDFIDIKEKQEKILTNYDIQDMFAIVAEKMGVTYTAEQQANLLASISTDKELNKQIQQKREDDAKPF